MPQEVQVQKLSTLKTKLADAGMSYTEGRLGDVHGWLNPNNPDFQEPCLIVNGYAVNWHHQGYVADGSGSEHILDQEPDADLVIAFLKG